MPISIRYMWSLAACLPCPAFAQPHYGPLLLYAQSPLQTNALTPELRSGFALSTDTVELATSGTIASVWATTHQYQADYYQNQLYLGMKWQFHEQWQLALQYRWNYALNNHLDGLTIAFHRWFGLDQNGREDVDRDRFYLSVPSQNVQLDDFENQTLSSALSTYLQYQIFDQPHHGLSFGGSLYYNDLDNGLLSNSRFEQALQLNYSYQLERHQLHLLAGISFHHSENLYRHISYRDNTASLGLSYQFAWSQQHQLLTEVHLYEGISNNLRELSKPSTEFILGYRYLMTNGALEVSMTENVFNMDNSTDIAFTLGYRHQLHGNEK